jgi:uncharacterized DUF497 family protein
MNDIRFIRDEDKSRANKRKHKVAFDEAQTVFMDEGAIRYFDPDHSADEDRFIMRGMRFALHHSPLSWAGRISFFFDFGRDYPRCAHKKVV